jgi:hypothetical protein
VGCRGEQIREGRLVHRYILLEHEECHDFLQGPSAAAKMHYVKEWLFLTNRNSEIVSSKRQACFTLSSRGFEEEVYPTGFF